MHTRRFGSDSDEPKWKESSVVVCLRVTSHYTDHSSTACVCVCVFLQFLCRCHRRVNWIKFYCTLVRIVECNTWASMALSIDSHFTHLPTYCVSLRGCQPTKFNSTESTDTFSSAKGWHVLCFCYFSPPSSRRRSSLPYGKIIVECNRR